MAVHDCITCVARSITKTGAVFPRSRGWLLWEAHASRNLTTHIAPFRPLRCTTSTSEWTSIHFTILSSESDQKTHRAEQGAQQPRKSPQLHSSTLTTPLQKVHLTFTYRQISLPHHSLPS
ncbi:hypothetical protein BU26DRAFT_142893 [Trematosphaeria pertusa]|uniref:Uncharacterized protein n=1 Tax=Trematosphaeria pertusa TaxID=390896 RepID=A0A6A6IXJ0_9PLEO|nr:uncharacterized protein BU26DRAFT_142893 [Trematosphaeria pertusa]KAF2254652.1 hypothetical protein BU26DRAFT_142893 [Trematosphaeria pertusa]